MNKMKTTVTAAFVIAAIATAARAETPVQQVARQFREYCLHESTDHGERLLDDAELPKTSPDQAAKLLASQKDDGSWPDVEYASQARSSWPPATHLTRALALTVYARRIDTPPADAAKSLAAVHKALAYWKQHDYQCPNWWYNQIGVPKIIGNTALLLDADLADDEKAFITGTVLPRAKVGPMTGQNRVWLAANGVMCAALLNEETLMRQAAAVIQEELTAGTAEGIQPDFSFHQHGPQQQFGNYGMAYSVEMSRWATVLRGTPYAFTPDKIGILRNFLLEGENGVVWRGNMDISSCGRQLFPNSPLSKAGVLRATMRAMAVADSPHAADYTAFVTRNTNAAPNDLIGDRYFWRSDYLIHRRPDSMTTLKMASTRVIGGETVNNENLSGLHLADGATYFYRNGHEYDDIFPVWDWRMIPGTTEALSDASLKWPTADLKKNAEFVGGVSDGATSCAAMDFHRDDLRAKKAWFFAGDVVVCLGADITSTGPSPIATTLNQCLLKTAVTVLHAGKQESPAGTRQDLKAADWVEQDGLRYTPLQPESLLLTTATQTGNWKAVFDSPATPKADVTKNIFTLWIDHGTHPANAAYSYAVSPAGAAPAPTILSNTAKLQAVQSGKAGPIAAVFWAAGSADLAGTSIQVDAPCLLLLDASRVTVSDPTQKLTKLRIELGGKSAVVQLPRAGDAGKSVTAPGLP